MISKAKQKYIHSLQRKKNRYQQGEYIAEGVKTIISLAQNGHQIKEIYCTEDFPTHLLKDVEIILIEKSDLKVISALQNPDDGLAIFTMPKELEAFKIEPNNWYLYLDRINDPGNLGTIIRLADWYGIKGIFLSKGTTDPYQAKVVQSTMGALAGVNLFFVEDTWLSAQQNVLPIFATVMDGKGLQKEDFPNEGILVMGNEANGISEDIKKMATYKVAISKSVNSVSESLNVAMATAVFLDRILG